MSTHVRNTRKFESLVSFLNNLYFENDWLIVPSYMSKDHAIRNNKTDEYIKRDYRIISEVRENSEDYARNIQIFVADAANHRRHTLISYKVTYWDSCCALAMLSQLRIDSRILIHPEYPAILSMLKDAMVFHEREMSSCHSLMFAFSDEEIPYQYEAASMMGFEEKGEPFISYKTNHLIHMMELVIPDEEKVEDAIYNYNHRDEEDEDWDMDDDGGYYEDEDGEWQEAS